MATAVSLVVTMGRIARFVLSSGGAILALLACAIWLWRRPRSTAARRLLIGGVIAYAVSAIYVVPFAVSPLLTLGYHRFVASEVAGEPTAVVVLGAGDQVIAGWDDQITLTLDVEASRVLETARVFRLIAPAWVISSGGLVDPGTQSEASAATMRDELVRLGVPADRIVLESASRDTHDEAVLIAPMLRALGIRQLVLVTSDIHMRRSLGAFRAVGWNAVPAIAPDPRRPTRWLRWALPSAHGLDLSVEVVHELLGIPYYWMRGWWRL